MESLSYRHGDDARYGGVDITISLTKDEAAALGSEVSTLADWFDTALWALAMFRNGSNPRGPVEIDPSSREVTPNRLYTVINDLDNRLLPRLEGIRDTAIRRHQELGGSLGELALAMDVAKSTAQSRRNVVMTGRDRPSTWERWAIEGGPQGRERCQACGHPGLPSDALAATEDGYLIHVSHTQDPDSGFHEATLVHTFEPSTDQD